MAYKVGTRGGGSVDSISDVPGLEEELDDKEDKSAALAHFDKGFHCPAEGNVGQVIEKISANDNNSAYRWRDKLRAEMITQENYDALTNPDPQVIYLIQP